MSGQFQFCSFWIEMILLACVPVSNHIQGANTIYKSRKVICIGQGKEIWQRHDLISCLKLCSLLCWLAHLCVSMCCVHSPWSDLFKSGTICCWIFLTLSVQKTGGWYGNIWTLNLWRSISSPHFCYSNWSGYRPVIWTPPQPTFLFSVSLCLSICLSLSQLILVHYGGKDVETGSNPLHGSREREGWWARENLGWQASLFSSFCSPWVSSLWDRVSYTQARSFLFI